MLVALTGGLGCGKSAVLKLFHDLGIKTISADQIVHELLKDESVKKRLKTMFGGQIFKKDGQIDRKRLAEIVFSSPDDKRRLEALLHPMVYERIIKEHEKAPDDIMVAEIPLLFETKSEKLFDKVITVYTPDEIAAARLKGRGMTIDEIDARLKSQLPVKEKVEKADFVIDNSGSLEETKEQVRSILESLKRLREPQKDE